MPQWSGEAIGRQKDAQGRWCVHQLTSSSLISINVYGEQPYTSPDGKRIAILRTHDWTMDEPAALLVADVDTLKIAVIEPRGRVDNVATSSWREWLHYQVRTNTGRQLWRVSLLTLDKELLYEGSADDPALKIRSTLSPDFRYLAGSVQNEDGSWTISRLDIERGEWETLLESEDYVGHVQYNPDTGDELLFQVNRGWRYKDGAWTRIDEDSVILMVVDADGTNAREIPMGLPLTRGGTGHECFIPGTGRVLFSTRADPERISELGATTLFHAAPGEDKPTPIPAPGCIFNHVSASKCGTYYVCDSYHEGPPGPVPLIVGNIKTGKRAVLVQTGASCGGAQHTHPHPYFTADNRHVIYNSDATGVGQVYEATVFDEFLASLG